MRKFLKCLCSAVLAAVMMLSTGITVFAENASGLWYIGKADDYEKNDYHGWTGSGTAVLDDTVYAKGSRCSVKLSNTKEYDYNFAEKAVTLEPFTTYKFSAKLKFSGYQLDPNATEKSSGAHIDVCTYIGDVYTFAAASKTTNSSKWKEVSCSFSTGAEKKDYYFRLCNSAPNAKTKGTVWFSDIKIEKAEVTNNWDVIVLILKNVDVNVDLHGRTTIDKPKGKGKTHYKESFDEKDIKHIKSITNRLQKSMGKMSDGLVKINNIDYATIDEPVTELIEYEYVENGKGVSGYYMDTNKGQIADLINRYLKKKAYNQVILFAPLDNISGGWLGLGGGTDLGICQVTYSKTGFFSNPVNKDFPEAPIVHEILHGVNFKSNIFDPNTPYLHENDGIYKNAYNGKKDDNYKYYCDYMRCKLPDGRGIDPRAFYRLSGEYTLVDGSMAVGGAVKQSDSFPINIASAQMVKIGDQTYTGKKITPKITLKDGDYTLKEGTDFTVSFENNKNIGTATVTINGKGIYTGKKVREFKIVKPAATGEKATVKVVKKDGILKVTWSEVIGAENYYIWVSRNGGNFEKIKVLDGSKKSYSLKYKSGTTYQFAITAYIPELGIYTEYGYSETV